MTQNNNSVSELNYSVANKAMRQVLNLTKTLSQVIKQFQGIMTEEISVEMRGGVVRTFTVGSLLAQCGVVLERGRVTLSGIKNAWGMYDENGEMATVRSIPAKTMINEQYPEQRRVYKYEVSETGEKWTPVSIKDKVAIDGNKWTIDIVLRGLLQAKFAAKFEKQIENSKAAWESLDKVYVFESRVNKGGETNKAVEYNKEFVEF